MTTGVANNVSALRSGDWTLVLFGLISLFVIGFLIHLDTGTRSLSLLLIGAALGGVFWAAQFGFASGWRKLVARRDARPILSHFLLLAIVTILTLTTINLTEARGSTAPISFSLPIGAIMFGIGMQLANGCGSGTLFSLGGGSGRMIIVLPFFVAGSLIGSLILPSMLDWGSYNAVVIGNNLPLMPKILLNLLIIAIIAGLIFKWSGRNSLQLNLSTGMVVSVLVISILCWLCIMVAGHPWGITFGFTVWGGKIWQALGGDLSNAAFWTWAGPARALENSVLADVSSLMNIGMIFGALVVSAYWGRGNASPWPSPPQVAAAILGGLMMGIGARLSFGCNIGAFLGGVSSGSLHGWVWFVCGLLGTWAGVKLRYKFSMDTG